MEELLECPNCQAIWGFDEIQFQCCDCCGWPDNEDEDEDWGEGFKNRLDID